jgi:acetyl esterase/lipase
VSALRRALRGRALKPFKATVIAVLIAAASACVQGADDSTGSDTASARSHLIGTEEYVLGVEADLYLPGEDAVPLVVMVPGGSWETADRSGLGPLAERMSSAGIAVVNASYRAAADGAHFPTPIEDVVCAVDFAVARLTELGVRPTEVILLGHSSGAHVAALAALGPDRFRGACRWPAAVPDALAILAGLYDLSEVPDIAESLFGVPPAEDPASWRAANAFAWVDARATMPVFLAHGAADTLVPVAFTTHFASALERAGHPVRAHVVPGAAHLDIFTPDVIAGRLEEWIASLR